jgi:long-chain fatty acid transport protein
MRTAWGFRIALLSSAVISGGALTSNLAHAGGFAIREQSAHYQGLSFAGDGAGGSLSSMFWNPAVTATLPGLNFESAYSLILPDAGITVQTVPPQIPSGGDDTANIASWAVVGASYAAYQLTPSVFVGMGINSPFGLATKPDNPNYTGSVLGRTTELLTVNANPTIAYRVAPGLMIGAGAQIQYADGKLRFATLVPDGPSTSFEGDDVAFGATAGILWSPAAGTSIGLGWRSQLTHTLEGTFDSFDQQGPVKSAAEADVKLPDIVTLSIQQEITPTIRLLGTIEWSNWSRFEKLELTGATGTIATISANWSDGWMFAVGAEYDWSRQLTLRTGVAYEISPVNSPEKRIITIPDSDRIWVSAGASYKLSSSMSIDLAYTHIFLEDSEFVRTPIPYPPEVVMTGDVEAATDIISVGLKMKWGAEEPLK